MKVAQLIADWIAEVAPQVYAVPGGMAMHLNDAICHHPGISVLGMHHEQACAYAAEAHARVTGKPAVVHVTCGPGGINALTGIACAYVDSLPMIVVAGQVARSVTTLGSPRQLGPTESPFLAMAEPVTKLAVQLSEKNVERALELAFRRAVTGRKGPVVIEVPIDVSAANVAQSTQDWRKAMFLGDPVAAPLSKLQYKAKQAADLLAKAERPVIIVGNGVRLGGACEEFRAFVDASVIPVVSSWNGADIIGDHSRYIGRVGQFGDRASNLAIQNADLILAIGTRLSIPQIGHHTHLFAPNAKKIVVDIDPAELKKPTLTIDMAIAVDAREFIRAVIPYMPDSYPVAWLARCMTWRDDYPVILPEYRDEKYGINTYAFIDELSRHLDDDAIVVTDVGMAFVSTMQALKLKRGQRLFHSSGLAPMGYGLPAAIGACIASGKKRQVVLIAGDGGMMFNLQELQTIAHHQLPIAIFVYENDGYHAMRQTQANYFGRESLSSNHSGISCPSFIGVAKAFGISQMLLWEGDLGQVKTCVDYARRGPVLTIVKVPRDQPLIPRVQSRMENGKFVPVSLDDMYPYLSRDELAATMEMSQ